MKKHLLLLALYGVTFGPVMAMNTSSEGTVDASVQINTSSTSSDESKSDSPGRFARMWDATKDFHANHKKGIYGGGAAAALTVALLESLRGENSLVRSGYRNVKKYFNDENSLVRKGLKKAGHYKGRLSLAALVSLLGALGYGTRDKYLKGWSDDYFDSERSWKAKAKNMATYTSFYGGAPANYTYDQLQDLVSYFSSPKISDSNSENN